MSSGVRLLENVLSIPVFRGCRLRGVFDQNKQQLYFYIFQSPFSGDVDCEDVNKVFNRVLGIVFQSPFSGDVDCETTNIYIEPIVIEKYFQSPFSGDVDCEDVNKVFNRVLGIVFQSPFSGDVDCESDCSEKYAAIHFKLSIPVFRGCRLRGCKQGV